VGGVVGEVMAVGPFWKCLHDHAMSVGMYDEYL